MTLLLYAVTLFVSAFLLFLVQPIIGAKVLPKLGGTPSVWNTCVVFFQVSLLIGYAYSHFATKLPVKRQILIHGLLLFVPFLILLPGPFSVGPFSVDHFRPVTGGNPTMDTLWLLALIVGIPFIVVSTTAPLLQKWFASTGHPAAKDPYFLYGASNLGSMLSLLLYAPVFEPLLGLKDQSWFYTFGFMALVAMVIACAAVAFLAPPTVQLGGKRKDEEQEKAPVLPPEPPPPPVTDIAAGPAPAVSQTTAPSPVKPSTATAIKKGGKKGKGRDLAKMGPSTAIAPAATAAAIAATTSTIAKPAVKTDPDEVTWLRRLRWIGLAAVPSSLMLGVITYICTDITAIPLFWVMPLALYLLSFILVFMRWPFNWLEQAHDFVLYAQAVTLAMLALFMVIANANIIVYVVLVMLLAFTVTALACHGELAKDRPSTKHLTEFYLLMSVGGAIGGFFNAIVAPLIFQWGIVEFGLAVAVAGLLRPTMRSTGWTEDVLDNMGESSGGKHSKGSKKIVKPSQSYSGLTLILDFAYPVFVLCLSAVLLFGFAGRGNPGAIVVCAGIPLIFTAIYLARPLRFGLALAGFLLVSGFFLHSGSGILHTTRSYFGVLRVQESAERYGDTYVPYTNLMHGTTNHGMALQRMDKGPGGKPLDLSRTATTYYHRQGPVGICMERFNWFPDSYRIDNYEADARMPVSLVGLGVPSLGVNLPMAQLVGAWSEPPYAVIGMGTATMASYARPFQTCHFYEIDEKIRKFSLPEDGSKPFFGYVKAAKERGGNIQILMGDARLRMDMPWTPDDMKDIVYEDVPSEKRGSPTKRIKQWEYRPEAAKLPFEKRGGPEYYYHLMVVDAFSSDAIPKHLITQEAIEMYMKHLVQGYWGDWIEVDPKDDSRAKDGTLLNPKFYDWQKRERKVDDKVVVEKRPWVPGGVLCVHTSNRHLRLVPVVTDTANVAEWDNQYDEDKSGRKDKKVTGLVANRGHDSAPGHTEEAKRRGKGKPDDIGHFTSEWVIVARDAKDLKHLQPPSKYSEWAREAFERDDTYWTPQIATGTYVWTDDHSNLMAVFRWPWQHRRE